MSQGVKNSLLKTSKLSMKVHATAVNSFNQNHSEYHMFRPSFSPKIVNRFLVDLNLATEVQPNNYEFKTNKSILELAAGSGKFTKNLVNNGWSNNLTIVEPSQGMLTSFRQNFPDVQALQGSSYSIDLPDNSVDSVIVAQGFHWFADSDSLNEINRVLKPNGTFGCIWNYDLPTLSQDLGTHESKYNFLFEGIDTIIEEAAMNEAETFDKCKKPYLLGNIIFNTHKWANEVTKYAYTFDVNVPQYRHGTWREFLSIKNSYFTPILKENYLFYKVLVKPSEVFKYWETRSYITDLLPEKKAEINDKIQAITQDNIRESDKVEVNDEILYKKIMGTHSIVLGVKK